ncbi:LtrD protein [Lactococcus lactis]|uniref:Uncharacterized protein n=1 Tax=Lactococcus lactis TaxID=1358 RepID=A0AAW5TR18_9LACT|nr:LtrD protein [Lactococcus lactis]MCW2281218.1 hypothetical protein [Lactococcus lactis]
MSMNEVDFQEVLSQFLLKDETSERPQMHPQKIKESKTAIQNKLNLYIEALEKNEIEIDLTDYKMALKQLKKMKAVEYEEIVMKMVENYETLKQKKQKVFPSASAPYPELVMKRQVADLSKGKVIFSSEFTETVGSDGSKEKHFFSDFRRRMLKKKSEK